MTAAREQGIEIADASEFRSMPGHGVAGVIEGQTLLLGNAALFAAEGVDAKTVR